MVARPSGATSEMDVLNYESGGDVDVSNTAIIPLGSNPAYQGELIMSLGARVHWIIDIQGYFTAGQTAAGGYIPLLSPPPIVMAAIGTEVDSAK